MQHQYSTLSNGEARYFLLLSTKVPARERTIGRDRVIRYGSSSGHAARKPFALSQPPFRHTESLPMRALSVILFLLVVFYAIADLNLFRGNGSRPRNNHPG
jgi:hypothetical protein